jgi:hypothetical protein
VVAALLTPSSVHRPFRTAKGTAGGLGTAYEPVPAVDGPIDGLPANAVQQAAVWQDVAVGLDV